MDFRQSWKEMRERAAKNGKTHGLIPKWISKQDKIYTEDDSSKCLMLNNFYLAQAFGKSDKVFVERPECAALFEKKESEVIDLKTKKKQARG
jgi:hypothetical protein